MMQAEWTDDIRRQLEAKRDELAARLDRITANLRRGLESDSEERAKQLEDSEVVDALGNDARAELAKIKVALQRMDSDEYTLCEYCGGDIGADRLRAHPYARACIDCAELYEELSART